MAYEELNTLLTENEKKVYLELLKLGESTASPILKKTGLQNSVFYRTINRLIEKGFVSYILKGKIKHFKASSPDIFLTQLKDKEEKIKNILPNLKLLSKTAESKTEAEVFLGLKGIKAMYYSFGPNEQVFEETLEKVYLPFRKYREEKKIKVYGIIKEELKGKVTKFKNTVEKYTNSPLPPNMAIFKDKIAITSWGEIPTGILIKGKDIAEQYKKVFWEIWKQAI
jgi:sugar-specific transcriptional regulator TrmB